MKQSAIKVGATYTGDVRGIVQRRVVAIGYEHCPGRSPIPKALGVAFMVPGPQLGAGPRKMYLDTFAKWAKREIK